jgi:translation initiation factor IF-2
MAKRNTTNTKKDRVTNTADSAQGDKPSTPQQHAVRPPVVAVMGHVDHGKTSILDSIRKTNVQEKEHGGITQHIGAYQITHNNNKITFIDTPGHAAFAQMRARGGRAADIVILVVAADAGVKPQTKEAILHTKAAEVPMIVAINKCDLPSANVQKTKEELARESIMVEDWGGDVVCVETSAKTKTNMAALLDAILAVAELQNLEADPKGDLEATIIESKLDRKRGVVVSCIVRNGTLHVGDTVTASGQLAKIKSITNDKGKVLTKAGPSTPIEILGFKTPPNVGDILVSKGSELAELSIDEKKIEIIGKKTKKAIAIVLRADTQGTLEAVKASLANLVSASIGATFSIKFILCSTGDITDSDVLLAQSSKGIIIGFNIQTPSSVKDLAKSLKVPIKTYKTIYELVEEAQDLLEGTAIEEEEKIKGRAKILKTFKLPSGDIVAGCEVLAGALKKNSRIFIYDKDPAEITEEDQPLYKGIIKKLKRGKEDVKLVGKDTECGILLKPEFEDLRKELFVEVI